jgi:carotenoid cleavage dioxygenase-like enzyme
MKMFKGDTVISGFQWLPEQGTNMTVLHVASKTMKRFRCAENFFAFHTVNMQVTDSGLILLDMLTFDDLSLLFALFIDSSNPRRTVGNVPYGSLRRLTIDPSADPETYVVKSRILDEYGYELPRINEAFDGKPYTYFYALTTSRPFSFPMDVIAKIDVVSGKRVLFQEDGLSLGEPVFIQDPNDSKVACDV